MVTGAVVAPSLGPTRTKADIAAHIARTIDTKCGVAWFFRIDQLNIDRSESLALRLVRLPAYSPNFNPNEAIPAWAREEITANTCLGTEVAV